MTFRNLLKTHELDPEIFDVIHKIPALPMDKPLEPEYFMIPVPISNTVWHRNMDTVVH